MQLTAIWRWEEICHTARIQFKTSKKSIMPAAAKSKDSRKAAVLETKPVEKSSKKQKVEEKKVEVEEEDDDEDDDEEEEDDEDEDEASDDDEEEEAEEAATEEPAEEEEAEEAEGGFKDENLECKDCGNEFIFTSGEQEFYQQKVCDRSFEAP